MRRTLYKLCSLLLSTVVATSSVAQELPRAAWGVFGPGSVTMRRPGSVFPDFPYAGPRPRIDYPYIDDERLERLIRLYEKGDPYLLLLRRPFLAAPQDEHIAVVGRWSKGLKTLPVLGFDASPPQSVRRSGEIDDAFLSKASTYIEGSKAFSSNFPVQVAKFDLLLDLQAALLVLREISKTFNSYYMSYLDWDDPLLIRGPGGDRFDVPQLFPSADGNINWYPQYGYTIRLSQILLGDDEQDRALMPCVLECENSSPNGLGLFVGSGSPFTLPMHQARDDIGYWVLMRSAIWDSAIERFGDIAKDQIGVNRTALRNNLRHLATVAGDLRIILNDLGEETLANNRRLLRLANLTDSVRSYKKAAEATLENIKANSRGRRNLISYSETKAEELERLTDKLQADLEVIESRIADLDERIENLEASYPRNGEQIFKLTETLAVEKERYRVVKAQVRKSIAERRKKIQELRGFRSAEGRMFPLVIAVSETILKHQTSLDQYATEIAFRRDRLVNVKAAMTDGGAVHDRLIVWVDQALPVLSREITLE